MEEGVAARRQENQVKYSPIRNRRPPDYFFSKIAYNDILIAPLPRLLSLSIDEIVRPRHNLNAIDRVIACVTMYDL